METRRSAAVDKLYKEEAILFPNSQAIHSNACDCLLLNNLEMYEVMLSLHKMLSSTMTVLKMHFFRSMVYQEIKAY